MSDEQIQDIEQSSPVAEHSAPQASEPAAPQASSGFTTPYEAFKSLPDFQGQDDLTIARNLYSSYNGYRESQKALQQYQSVIPYAQEYLRNQRDFEAWRAAQAEASKPKAPEKKRWFDPPQIEENYKSYIVRDPQTGKEIIDPNAPISVQEKLRAYQDYTANFARKFVTDPENTLKPFIEEVDPVTEHIIRLVKMLVKEDINLKNLTVKKDKLNNIVGTYLNENKVEQKIKTIT